MYKRYFNRPEIRWCKLVYKDDESNFYKFIKEINSILLTQIL